MDPNCTERPGAPPQRRKEPIDGIGPRGFPDCYYKSRTLNSTFRYVRFVKKLRAIEEEQRKGHLNTMKELKDQQICDFFIRCDRRSLINNVARRVELCMQSYEADLEVKRKRLLELLTNEEHEDIRKFVVQAQAGTQTIWEEKMARLQHLLDKRKQEHLEKYKDIPISKCVHVTPCLYKLRARDAENIQLYQMRMKKSRELSQKEIDKMWYEVAMKESDALATRMEIDAIERYRRDLECKEHSDKIVEQRRQQKEKDRERLKQEQKLMKEQFEEDMRKEREEDEARKHKRMETGKERSDAIEQRREMLAKQQAEEKIIDQAWDSLQGQGRAAEQAKVDLIKRKEKEQDICNREMINLRDTMARRQNDTDDLINAEAKKIQDALDKKRCNYLLWSQKTNQDVRKGMIEQIKENKASREELQKKMEKQDEYHRELFDQQQQLINLKARDDAASRKQYQRDLLDQIEYNKLLKERARQEEIDQRRKGYIAAKEYQDEINNMMCRRFHCDAVHPFMRRMVAGVEPKEKCPCSKPDYCQ